MSLIDDIKRDREAGTRGPWVQGGTLNHTSAFDFYDPFGPDGGSVACVSGEPEGEASEEDMANARRIARVPAMEAALLAAEELAEAITHERELACQDMGMQLDASKAVDAALTAYREALQ